MSNEREQLIARLRRFAVVLEARGETYDAETCEQAIASLSAPVAERGQPFALYAAPPVEQKVEPLGFVEPDRISEYRKSHTQIEVYAAPPAQQSEIDRLKASERSAWNAAVQRDEEIDRLKAAQQKAEHIDPVVYRIIIRHWHDGQLDVSFEGVGDEPDDLKAIAFALHRLADDFERGNRGSKEQ